MQLGAEAIAALYILRIDCDIKGWRRNRLGGGDEGWRVTEKKTGDLHIKVTRQAGKFSMRMHRVCS